MRGDRYRYLCGLVTAAAAETQQLEWGEQKSCRSCSLTSSKLEGGRKDLGNIERVGDLEDEEGRKGTWQCK